MDLLGFTEALRELLVDDPVWTDAANPKRNTDPDENDICTWLAAGGLRSSSHLNSRSMFLATE